MLRGIAAFTVVLFHFFFVWVPTDYGTWLPATLLSKYAIFPPVLAGDVSIAVFFLISGFIITHAAQSETHTTFIVKRLFRIYPPHIVCCLVIVAIILGRGHLPANSTQLIPVHFDFAGFAASVTLVNYVPFNAPTALRFTPFNLVAWTLMVEMIFYALTCILLPLVQRRPRLAILAMAGVIMLSEDRFSSLFIRHSERRIISSIAIIVLGQVLYYLWKGRLRFREYVVLSVMIVAIYVFGRMRIDSPSIMAFTAAYLVFIIALLANDRVRMGRVTQFLSDISYSLYLYHVPIGFMALGLLVPHIGLPLALTGAFIAAVIVSGLSWHFIEKPWRRYARGLLARRRAMTTVHAPAREAFVAIPGESGHSPTRIA